jgi:hypothetical protein
MGSLQKASDRDTPLIMSRFGNSSDSMDEKDRTEIARHTRNGSFSHKMGCARTERFYPRRELHDLLVRVRTFQRALPFESGCCVKGTEISSLTGVTVFTYSDR